MSHAHVVRYGRMRLLGPFRGPDDLILMRGMQVVIQTDRGTELAEVLCPLTELAADALGHLPPGEIVRIATEEDLRSRDGLAAIEREGFEGCLGFIALRQLQMDLVDVEAILGGQRLVFYYLAEKRVDFRDLVKDLARTFRTRIEMRQIGVRDEAKLLADFGDCGQPVCCNSHLTRMPPVSMRMAKLQKSTLDPSKISGRCGRLKCCLRYEFDTYSESESSLPRLHARVETDRGIGHVVALEILAQKMTVEFEAGGQAVLGPADVQRVLPGRK